MQDLIVKNSISKNLLKKSSISLINNFNKCALRQYTIQQNKNILNSNQISLLNTSSNISIPSIPLNNTLLSYFNNFSTSLQISNKFYSTEKDKSTDKETQDKKIVEEEEEEEEEDDEIKNITDMKIKISDSAVDVRL